MILWNESIAQSPPVILCLGDSLTAGFGVPRGASYPDLLEMRLRQKGFPHRVVNAGVSGDTTAGALRRLDWVLQSKPTLAVVTLGANDGLRGLNISDMKDNLATIIKQLQAKGIKVILGGMRVPPNYGDAYSQRFADVFPKLAKETGVKLIPFFLADVAGHRQLNQADGIHPNTDGYRQVLENVWKIIEPLLKLGS